MSHKPPIDIKSLAKSGVLDEDRFFRLLSEKNNYVDVGTVKNFYMGLVETITKDLRDNGVARLPHLGDFALVKKKDHIGWTGKIQQMIRGKYILKFYPKQSWKQYFTKLEEKTGREGALDPREKVLNREI